MMFVLIYHFEKNNCSNLKLHQALEVKNILNVMLQLTFNPGLTLTGFRTTRPRTLILHVVMEQGMGWGHKFLSGPFVYWTDLHFCSLQV